MNRALRWLAPLGLAFLLAFGLAGSAAAQKVGNPGTFNFKVDSGLMKVKTQEFPFDDAQNINFNGTVDQNGNINIPTMTFPTFPISASGFNLTVYINVVGPTTGTINPMTGAASLRLKVWIKIDGVPLGGGCRIASAGSPVDVNALITGTSAFGQNTRTGVPYNLSTGKVTLVNATFGVPASSDCGPAGGTVDSTVGLPSPAGNNQAEFNITTTPKLTRGINPALSATPATGTAPFSTTLNASASTVAAGPATYRWDFTNDGTIDQTTSTPTANHTYTVGGTPTARVVVVDSDGDSAETTTQLTVNAYPDLGISAAHNGSFRVGNTETYRINLQNAGYAATSGPVNVTSTLPAGLTYDSVTGAGWGCSASGQDLTCSRSASIPVGGNASELGVNVDVGAAARPSVTPTFTVQAAGDNGPGNNSAADPTQVTATDLRLNLSHSVHAIKVGADPANLIELSAENVGDAATVGPTVIEDVLPAGLTPDSASGNGWSCVINGQTVTCTRSAAIAPGETTDPITLAVSGVLDPGVLGVTVNNQATVTAADDVDSANDTATDPTLILDGQDVGITKSHLGEFTAGQQEHYSISVENYGTDPTTGTTTVTDVLPNGLTFVAADGGPDWSCSESLGTVTCDHSAPLGAGDTAPPIDLTVAVGVAAIPAVTNTATVATPDDPNPANDSSSDVTVVKAIDLEVVKTHAGVIRVGKETTYTLAVRNAGDSPTNGVSTVTDVLPAGLTFVSADGGPDWSCSENLGTVTCDHAGVLAPGQSATGIELKVAVGPAAAPAVTNTATVATDDDFNPANDSTSDTADAIDADTAVSIGRTGTFRPGQTGTYQVTVRNEGSVPTANQTGVEVSLGNGLTFDSVTGSGWNCTESGGIVNCDRPAPLAGDTTAPAIRIKVAVGAGAVPTTTTTVNATTVGDRYTPNDVASDTATVTAPDLVITTAHEMPPYRDGDSGNVTHRVENGGTGATTGPITVTDTLPNGIDPIAATGVGWSCTINGQTVTCERDQALAAGASAGQISIEVRPTAAAFAPGETTATVSNSATVATEYDSNPANDQVSDQIDLVAVDALIGIDGPDQVTVGENMEWHLIVQNQGSAATRGTIRVTDVLPDGFSPRNSDGDGWVCSTAGSVVTCDTNAEIAPGGVLPRLTVRARVGADAAAQVSNQAGVSAAGDVIAGNNEVSFDTDVTAAPDLAVELESRAPAFRVGRTGGYELRVKNVGSSPAGGPVELTIDLPAGASFAGLDHGQGWTCDDSVAGEVTCRRNSPIEPDQISALGFRLAFGKSVADTITVTASLTAPTDGNAANDEASATDPVNRIDLALTRVAQGAWTKAGTGRYTLDVKNAGTAATDGPVTITETLPYGATLKSASGSGWSCQVDRRLLECVNPGPIAPGATSRLEIELDLARQATSPVAATSAVATDGDVNPANDTATERIELAGANPAAPGRATFRSGKAPITSSGVITVWMSCPAGAAGKCRGILSLKTAGKIRIRKVGRKYRKGKISLGKGPYVIAPGRSVPVQVPISRKALKAMKLNRTVKVIATATGEGVSKSLARITIRRTR
ncbi:MAG: PKD domain-containing protein [Solirubrobacterales bacterium]|nr:PKD domain-containing protein [Solirubrobacterales bacterium]